MLLRLYQQIAPRDSEAEPLLGMPTPARYLYDPTASSAPSVPWLAGLAYLASPFKAT